MKWYYIYGEYGPIGGMSVDRYVRARNETVAQEIFSRYVINNYGDLTWSRMGFGNMYCQPAKRAN